MYSIMNCTPHPVTVLWSVFEGYNRANVWVHDSAGLLQVPRVKLVGKDGDRALAVPPSGYRLACEAITSGMPLGCSVRYQLSNEAMSEVPKIQEIFAQQEADMVVIASEISVRSLNGSLFEPSAGLPIRAMWPVLASESLRLPMSDRWADRLATLYRPVHNDAGEVVGEVAAHRLQDWALEQGATQQDLDDSQSRHGEGMARAKHIARVERKLGRGAHARLTHAQQCVLEACRVGNAKARETVAGWIRDQKK